MKITNWKKHLEGGILLALFYVLSQLIGAMGAICVSVVAWEIMQLGLYLYNKWISRVGRKEFYQWVGVYITSKWLDCLVDMCMGILGFTAIYMIASILGFLKDVTVIW